MSYQMHTLNIVAADFERKRAPHLIYKFIKPEG